MRRASVVRRFFTVVAALAACAPAAGAWAQQQPNYKELPLHKNGPKWTALAMSNDGRQVANMVRGRTPLDAALFDSYFTDVVFPLFTQWKPVAGPGNTVVNPLIDDYHPQRMRSRFKIEYLMQARSNEVHERLNDLVLANMQKIADDNYHPVCRANAMMMIADLSADEQRGTPWKKAFPVLLKAATADDTIDAVRAPALRGAVRHAEAGLDATSAQQLSTAMLALLNQANPPEGRTREGHDWYRRRAIDALIALDAAAPNPNFVKSLVNVLDDETASMPLRCDAAAALSKIKFAPPDGMTVADVARLVGKTAAAVIPAELEKSRSDARMLSTEAIQRRLSLARQGLAGPDGRGGIMTAAQAPDARQLIIDIVRGIDQVITATYTPVMLEEEMIDNIKLASAALESIANRAAAPAAAPGAVPATAPGAVPVGPAASGAAPEAEPGIDPGNQPPTVPPPF